MTSPTSSQTKSSRKRKRRSVHFETDSVTSEVKRQVIEIPTVPSSMMTGTEKAVLWLQSRDHQATLADVVATLHDCHVQQAPVVAEDQLNSVFALHKTAIAQAYWLACNTSDSTSPSSADNPNSATDAVANVYSASMPQSERVRMAILSSCQPSLRGLESRTIPVIAQERKLRRLGGIGSVVQLQRELRANPVNSSDDIAQCLRLLSEQLSSPARHFAWIMGQVDSISALMECLNTPEFANNIQASPDDLQGVNLNMLHNTTAEDPSCVPLSGVQEPQSQVSAVLLGTR